MKKILNGALNGHEMPFYGETAHAKQLAESFNKMQKFTNVVGEVNFGPIIDKNVYQRRFTHVVPVAFYIPEGVEMQIVAERMMKVIASLHKVTPVYGFLLHCGVFELQSGGLPLTQRVACSYPHVSMHQREEAEKVIEFLLEAYELPRVPVTSIA